MGKVMEDDPAILSAPFSVYGGKKYLAAKLVKYIPQHGTYVEPFAGAASLLFAKPKSPHEILGDIDKVKLECLRFIKKHSPDDRLDLLNRDWKRSRDKFSEMLAWKPKTGVDFMYRELYLRWNSFGCRGESWALNNAAAGWERWIVVRLPAYQERLQRVHIFESHWEDTVKRADAPDTFFYLDPPYIGTSNDRAAHFVEPSTQELLDAVAPLTGSWLMSNSEDPSLVTAFRGYEIRRIAVPTQIDQMHTRSVRSRIELLISNYKLPE